MVPILLFVIDATKIQQTDTKEEDFSHTKNRSKTAKTTKCKEKCIYIYIYNFNQYLLNDPISNIRVVRLNFQFSSNLSRILYVRKQ